MPALDAVVGGLDEGPRVEHALGGDHRADAELLCGGHLTCRRHDENRTRAAPARILQHHRPVAMGEPGREAGAGAQLERIRERGRDLQLGRCDGPHVELRLGLQACGARADRRASRGQEGHRPRRAEVPDALIVHAPLHRAGHRLCRTVGEQAGRLHREIGSLHAARLERGDGEAGEGGVADAHRGGPGELEVAGLDGRLARPLGAEPPPAPRGRGHRDDGGRAARPLHQGGEVGVRAVAEESGGGGAPRRSRGVLHAIRHHHQALERGVAHHDGGGALEQLPREVDGPDQQALPRAERLHAAPVSPRSCPPR